jgi:glycosidase
MNLQSIAEVDLPSMVGAAFHPSPAAWEDEVLYFLMLDRFSDGRELDFPGNDGGRVTTGTTTRFQAGDAGNAVRTEAEASAWRQAGAGFTGGNLRGLESKLGYLKRMGITAVWLSPVLKQVASQESYHGYGIQDFLQVEPRFGTAEDLRSLVATAHGLEIRVILDIILNHAGDVFSYDADRYPSADVAGTTVMDPRWDGRPYVVHGYRAADGQPSLPFAAGDLIGYPDAWPDGAVWPAELQNQETFTRRGRIINWDYDPEYLEGDFETLKDIHHGVGDVDHYEPSAALKALTDCYRYWMAYADLDGFRVDTVKHMDAGATRFFTSVIKEFATSLGKENFYLIGEITGGRTRAVDTMELTGLDAALGIDDVQDKLEYLVKGQRNPVDYFNLFRNSTLVGKESHTWFRNRVVTMFDDHDQVRKGSSKARFCADPGATRLLPAVLALNVLTLGIPCIYYGTEQAFDGQGDNDRYIRESMFGGPFGAFRSAGLHFFDEDAAGYRALADLLRVRRQRLTLRRGRQYLREISGNGTDFGLPAMVNGRLRSVVPWSRLFTDQETVCAINTDPDQPRTAWVTIDNDLHLPGQQLRCLYSTDPAQRDATVTVEPRNGKAVLLTLPPAGVVVFE